MDPPVDSTARREERRRAGRRRRREERRGAEQPYDDRVRLPRRGRVVHVPRLDAHRETDPKSGRPPSSRTHGKPFFFFFFPRPSPPTIRADWSARKFVARYALDRASRRERTRGWTKRPRRDLFERLISSGDDSEREHRTSLPRPALASRARARRSFLNAGRNKGGG